eukprot:c46138_g1_i1 orf=24-218(-)
MDSMGIEFETTGDFMSLHLCQDFLDMVHCQIMTSLLLEYLFHIGVALILYLHCPTIESDMFCIA